VVGPPGSGKSNLAGYCCMYLEQKKDKIFSVNQIANSALEAITLFQTTERYGEVMYDEGMKSLMSRRAMSTENIEQLSSFAQIRQKRNLIVFVIVQDLGLVEKHIKSSRANSVFRCIYMNDGHGMPKQGMVYVYGPRAVKKIKIDSQGIALFPKENFVDTFPDISNTKFWEEYELKSDKQKDNSLQTSLDRVKESTGVNKRRRIDMELYSLNLRKKGKSVRQIQSELQKKFKDTFSVSHIHTIITKSKNRV
jgi:hypothetical protein